MNRHVIIWLSFAACAAIGFGVLGWFTREMVRMRHETAESERLAAIEENVRLALWRMDSAMASVHGLEAARPWRQYESFVPIGAAFSDEFSPLSNKSILTPSPLLLNTPPFVRLHFQIEPDGSVHSPQVPRREWWRAAITAGAATDQLESAVALLEDFSKRVQPSTLLAELVDQPPTTDTLLRQARPSTPSDETTDMPESELVTPTRGQVEPPQLRKSAAEQEQREELYAAQNALAVEQARSSYASSGRESPRSSYSSSGEGFLSKLGIASPARDEKAAPAPNTTGTEEAAAFADANAPQTRADLDAADTIEPDLAINPEALEGGLQARWIGSELVFVRRVSLSDRTIIQGVWLNWPELETWLRSRIEDLLPAGTLRPVPQANNGPANASTRKLAFLPVVLEPGYVPVVESPDELLTKITLMAAWISLIAVVAALAALLAGTLRLSERRGAFVSAVTHELRTPLTTFRMYTEMLAGGMVRDENRKQEYLGTLHKESDRLSHLVENVLSYARLERGRASSRIEDTTPGALFDRMEERLRQRAEQDGMTFSLSLDEDAASRTIHTDVTAVEQIVFNLVDNAAKYGGDQNGGGKIEVSARLDAKNRLEIRVADGGPGIDPSMRNRLFKPFSKSANEAAQSRPGVGLGLALCRRLARDELNGDLVLEKTSPDGTVFRLDLSQTR